MKFHQFTIVILLFAAAIVLATLNGAPHFYYMGSMILCTAAGFFAAKFKFGRVK